MTMLAGGDVLEGGEWGGQTTDSIWLEFMKLSVTI